MSLQRQRHQLNRPLGRVATHLKRHGPTRQAVAWFGLCLLRLSSHRAGLVLVYHGVGEPHGRPEHELVPTIGESEFGAHLRYLSRYYRVVPAAEIRESAARRRRGERFPVALTFDDDLGSHRRVVAPMLEALHLHATFFLTGEFLSGGGNYWWQLLQEAWNRSEANGDELPRTIPALRTLADPNLREIGAAIEGLPLDRRRVVAAELTASLGAIAQCRLLEREDVLHLMKAGHMIGFHTADHDRLDLLSDHELSNALTFRREQLEASIGRPMHSLAYPHGAADARVASVALAHCYGRGFTTETVAVNPTDNPALIGRIAPLPGGLTHLSVPLVRALVRSWVRRGRPRHRA